LQKRVSRLAPAWRRRIGAALCAPLIAVERPLQLIWRGGGEVDGCADLPVPDQVKQSRPVPKNDFPRFCLGDSKAHAWSAPGRVDEFGGIWQPSS
jgi:hypothetical protein